MSSKASKDTILDWRQTRGRCGGDPPSELPDDIAHDAINVVLATGGIALRRPGWVGREFVTGDKGVNFVRRWVPPASTGAGPGFLWVTREATPTMRTWFDTTATDVALTLIDAMQAPFTDLDVAALNGKLYVAYNSAVNRLHVLESPSSTSLRRSGMATPAAPTAANTGSGTYAATLRYYRIQWRVKSGSLVVRQSNLGTALSFTPSGSGSAVRVTQPTLANEGETHWVVYGSADGTTYYDLSGEVAIGTTTYDDSENPADYDDNSAAPEEGAFSNWPSVKFLLSIGDRLMGFGVWETSAGDAMTPKNGRVYFSPVLDSTATDDGERISNTDDFRGHIDVSRDAGAHDRALCGPLDNSAFVGTSLGIYLLSITGDAEVPFRRVQLTDMLGCVNQWSTFMGEDENGRPCVYFLDPSKGPYRYGAKGFEWLGYDVQDYWATWNGNATTRTAHGAYDPWHRRCYFWIATGSANEPDKMLVFHILLARYDEEKRAMRAGWTIWPTGAVPSARCSATLQRATIQGERLVVYAGGSTNFMANDSPTETQDSTRTGGALVGVTFQAYVQSKAWAVRPWHQDKILKRAYLVAAAQAATTIGLSTVRNFGDETDRTSSVSIAAVGSETRVMRKFEDIGLAEAYTFQIRIGDPAAVAIAPWVLDMFTATIEVTERER